MAPTAKPPASKSSASFEALFDLVPQLGWSASRDGVVDFYNRSWCEYTGTSLSEMRGMRWMDFYEPAAVPRVVERWQSSLATGAAFEMEVRLRRRDGLSRWFHTRIDPTRDESGEVVRWICISTDIDDEKQAVESAERRLAALLENKVEGVCLSRVTDGVIVQTSSTLDAMLGFGPGELVGQKMSAILHSDGGVSAEQLADEAVQMFERRGSAVQDISNARKDGSVVWSRRCSSRLDHSVHGPVWLAVHQDISEARSAEQDADNFFDNSIELLAIAGLDGYFKRMNPAWERTLGWTRAELMSKTWLDFTHPDDKEATLQAGGQLAMGLPVISFVNRYVGNDGSWHILEWRCVADPARGIIFAAANDVTVAREADRALQEVSDSLAITLDSIAEGVIATDTTGTITRMNPVAERLTGWRFAEAVGKPVQEVLSLAHEDTRVAVVNPVEETLRESKTVQLANRTLLRRRDGTEVAIADSCAPIRTSDGLVRGAVLVLRDLSGERAADAVTEKLQKQLVFTDRLASVGTLAAGMAHEINNPLAYVSANVDDAIEEVRNLSGGSASGRMKDLEEMLVDAREGVARVAKIVRGMKTFSRIEEQRIGVIDLLPVIELSINMAFNEIRHRARLVKDFGKLPAVDGDDARLGQVFLNLIVNAAQAFASGSTDENEIRVVTWTDASGHAVVEVRDNGPGIESAHLQRIFDPFFTTKAVGVGTGLGLAISHNIVVGMGGQIAVESVVGRGTTFRVSLPPSSAIAAVTTSQAPAVPVAVFRPARVLLLDDEPSIGMAIGRVLRGHDVTMVTTGQEALALLGAGKDYDVVLSDLMMPGMSGIELYRILVERYPKIASRVVFVTGGAFTSEAAAFLDSVDNEHMDKPFNSAELRALVQKFVKPPTIGTVE